MKVRYTETALDEIEFAVRDSQIVESLGKIWVQPSGFKILLYGLSEPAFRCQRDSRFMVFCGRAARQGTLAHVARDSIVFNATVENSVSAH